MVLKIFLEEREAGKECRIFSVVYGYSFSASLAKGLVPLDEKTDSLFPPGHENPWSRAHMNVLCDAILNMYKRMSVNFYVG